VKFILKLFIILLVKKDKQISDSLELSAIVRREGRFYISLCPEFDVASQGKSVEEALANLKEALELYLEDNDIEKPSETEVPTITIVKVDLRGSTRNLRSKGN
jgi:predicted RNase H-like HicB family nuclease